MVRVRERHDMAPMDRPEDGWYNWELLPYDDLRRVLAFEGDSMETLRLVSGLPVWLRLVNPADEDASITVSGIDDHGASPGTAVTLAVPAGAARTVHSWELESGAEGLAGSLGDVRASGS